MSNSIFAHYMPLLQISANCIAQIQTLSVKKPSRLRQRQCLWHNQNTIKSSPAISRFRKKQEALRRTNRLLFFNMTRTA
jgi:hypothetical protein